MTPTTKLPTEVGTYLFAGSRDGRVCLSHVRSARGSEVVRVRRDGAGKLMYLGKEIFYRPEDAVGAWLLITEAEASLIEEANAAVLDAAARTMVPEAFSDEWWGTRSSRKGVVDQLAFPAKDAESLSLAEKVFDRAVELGVIELDPEPGYEGWWRLRKEEP